MKTSIAVVVFLVLALQHSSMGLYIRKAEESTAKESAAKGSLKNRNDEWGLFKNTLGLTKEKVDILKSQKDQQGTKELLNRFIKENPKYLSASTSNKKNIKKQPTLQFKRLFRALINQLKNSNGMLKTSFNFELADKPPKPLKRARRKIAVKMVSDMSSERVDHLLKMFYQQHNIQPLDYDVDTPDQPNDDRDYIDADLPKQDLDSDYAYDNLYDDEGDVDLTAKSRQNLEYGSFQDLILQAKRNQWERESEETKLHSPRNEHFI